MPSIDEADVVEARRFESPAKYILAYNVCWWVADGELWVANEGSWEHAMPAKDVENWEGTPWEDEPVTFAMIDERRRTLVAVFASLD